MISFSTPEKVEENFVIDRDDAGEMLQEDSEFRVCSEDQHLVSGVGLFTGEVDAYGYY